MFCQQCGRQLPDRARFCPACGADQYAAWNAAAPAPRPEPPKTAPAPAAKPKEKFYDKIWFWLLVAAALVIWAFYPSRSDEGPSSGPSAAPEREALEELVPAGVPILDSGAIFLGGDSEESYAAYDAQQEIFWEGLDAAIRQQQPQVCIITSLPLNYDTLGEAYGYPYFWLKDIGREEGGYAFWHGENVSYFLCDFVYSEPPDRVPAMQAEVDAARERYLNLIPAGSDGWTAARIVHDELVRRVTYDHSLSGGHIYDIYGALVEGSAVCQGYAYAFSYVMTEWNRRCGNAAHLTGNVNSCYVIISEDHAWNSAWFLTGGNDTMVDVTWDDPDLTDAYGEPYILYNYFGLTEEEIEATSHHEIEGINSTPISEFFEGEDGNYHKHEGCYLSSFDLNAIASIFSSQYNAGKNVLTVRFQRQEDYDRIMTWCDGSTQELNDILARIGCFGSCAFLPMDEGRTFNILLNYPET